MPVRRGVVPGVAAVPCGRVMGGVCGVRECMYIDGSRIGVKRTLIVTCTYKTKRKEYHPHQAFFSFSVLQVAAAARVPNCGPGSEFPESPPAPDQKEY